MRKLSLVIAALFLFGSAPAFAQGSGGTTEPGAAAGTESGGKAEKSEKKTKKKAKKGAKKAKGAADAGM